MTPYTVDKRDQHLASEPLGVITPAQLEEAQRDPALADFLARADEYLAELEQQGRSI